MQSIFQQYKYGIWTLTQKQSPTGNAAAVIMHNFVTIADLFSTVPVISSDHEPQNGEIVVTSNGFLSPSGVQVGLLPDHIGRTDNPHATTAAQVGAYTTQQTDQLLSEQVTRTSGFVAYASAPEGAEAGDAYFDTTEGHAFVYDGLVWNRLDGAGLTLRDVCQIVSKVIDAANEDSVGEE